MAYDEIIVQLPVQEATQSIEIASFGKQTVTVANGIKIKDAFKNKNNSLNIIIESTATSTVTVKAGDNYPNAMLGDLELPVTANEVTSLIIEDISRFENRDGSICLDFGTAFVGTIFAVAKRSGLKPVA